MHLNWSDVSVSLQPMNFDSFCVQMSSGMDPQVKQLVIYLFPYWWTMELKKKKKRKFIAKNTTSLQV